MLIATLALATPAVAATRFVSTHGVDAGDCTDSGSPCATIQYAVDATSTGDEIRVSGGTYTGVHSAAPAGTYASLVPPGGVIRQVVFIDGKTSLTIRGGYNGNFSVVDLVTHETFVDPSGDGRAIYVANSSGLSLENLTIRNGNADGLRGDRVDANDYVGLDSGGGVYVDSSLRAHLSGRAAQPTGDAAPLVAEVRARPRSARVVGVTALSGVQTAVTRVAGPTVESSTNPGPRG